MYFNYNILKNQINMQEQQFEEINFYQLLKNTHYNEYAEELCCQMNLIYFSSPFHKVNIYLVNNLGNGDCSFYSVKHCFEKYDISHTQHNTKELKEFVIDTIKSNEIFKDYIFDKANPETELIFSNISKIFNIKIVVLSSIFKPVIYSPNNDNGNNINLDKDKIHDSIFILHHNNHYQSIIVKYLEPETNLEIMLNKEERIWLSNFIEKKNN